MGQIRHGSATYFYPAGDLHGKSAGRARTPSEQQYSDPLPPVGSILRMRLSGNGQGYAQHDPERGKLRSRS